MKYIWLQQMLDGQNYLDAVKIYIVHPDCKRHPEVNANISCTNGTLEIRWPTDMTYDGGNTDAPSDILLRLRERMRGQFSLFEIFIISRTPS